jgi:diaminohydroxyphosphoribosylaminopyrimidine deaminase/5-amino-6-(5-phosphoribosylamino)uracil reductase
MMEGQLVSPPLLTGERQPAPSPLPPGDGCPLAGAGGGEGERKALVEVVNLPECPEGVNLASLLELLGRLEVCTVLVEAGGTLLGSLFDRGLADKVAAFVAPVIVGGRDAPGAIGGAGVYRIAEALRLERVSYRRVGGDMLVTGYVRK